jgi:hypothetical protein
LADAPVRLPREAREGLMRVWLEILRERHPGVEWVDRAVVEVTAGSSPYEGNPPPSGPPEPTPYI